MMTIMRAQPNRNDRLRPYARMQEVIVPAGAGIRGRELGVAQRADQGE